jgi:hypothetical protein
MCIKIFSSFYGSGDFPASPPKETRNEGVDADETGVGRVCISGSCILGQHVSQSIFGIGGKKTATSLHFAPRTNS